jgi:predicted CopG family antitoxin
MSKEKEAKTLSTRKYVEGDMQFTETAKQVDPDTDILTTPWGTKVNAHDVTRVLDEYYSLSKEDQEREKKSWVELISKMVGQREDGLKIVDIELAADGSKRIRFIYR